jgi:hypothetical protein
MELGRREAGNRPVQFHMNSKHELMTVQGMDESVERIIIVFKTIPATIMVRPFATDNDADDVGVEKVKLFLLLRNYICAYPLCCKVFGIRYMKTVAFCH